MANMIFTNSIDMQLAINNVLELVIHDVAKQIIEQVRKEVVNKAYVNHSKTGDYSDLFQRDYVKYYNGTGTPTFEFLNAFKMIESGIGKLIVDLVYDQSEISTFEYNAHSVGADALLHILDSGDNYNDGAFLDSIEEWIIKNIRGLIVNNFAKNGLSVL